MNNIGYKKCKAYPIIDTTYIPMITSAFNQPRCYDYVKLSINMYPKDMPSESYNLQVPYFREYYQRDY